MAHNGVGTNLPILNKKMKARRGTLDHGLGRLDEQAVHADVANAGNVAAVTRLPVDPDIARWSCDPRRKSAGR
jgi:hypothetical protein